MKTKQPPRDEKDELDDDEWCFLGIPESELKACFIYEYARELAWRFPATLDRIVKSEGARVVRARPEKSKLDFGKIMRDYVPDFRRISKGKFPKVSWQKLHQKVRLMLVEAANNAKPDDIFLRDATITPIRELRELRISDETLQWANQPLVDNECLSQTAHGLKINFSKSDSAIKRAFAEWLPKERKRLGVPEIKYEPQTGRGGFSDCLNALGALRVVKHYPKKQLVDYADTSLKVAAPYNHLPDLYRAAKKARNLLGMLS